jgi:hypothetical protein
MMEALSSSKTSVRTRATLRKIPEDGILHSHRRENLKSFKDSGIFRFLRSLVLILKCMPTFTEMQGMPKYADFSAV